MFEPVNPQWSTPAWGEFGAWRRQPIGRHIGLDYYVPPGTPLFASGDGTVEVVSFHAGGHGHFIIIRYDAGYRVSVSHMLARSPLSTGDRVTAFTRIGTVGDTGNAEGIIWNGRIHAHAEVRRISNAYIESPRQVLKPLDRSGLAGGGGTEIDMPLTPEDIEAIADAVWRKAINHAGKDSAAPAATHLSYGRRDANLAATDARLSKVAAERAQLAAEKAQAAAEALTAQAVAQQVWSYPLRHAGEDTTAQAAIHLTYGRLSANLAAIDSAATRAALEDSAPMASTKDGFTAEDRKRLEAVPTADQNGAAARSAIVKL